MVGDLCNFVKKMASQNGGLLMEGDYEEKKNAPKSGLGGG